MDYECIIALMPDLLYLHNSPYFKLSLNPRPSAILFTYIYIFFEKVRISTVLNMVDDLQNFMTVNSIIIIC